MVPVVPPLARGVSRSPRTRCGMWWTGLCR